MSLFKKLAYAVLSGLLFLGFSTPLAYAENTPATVGLMYQKYSDLTPQQQSQVIKSTPNEKIIQENVSYMLVYAPCSSNKPTGILPNTGDTLTTITVAFIGVSAVLLSGYLVYKNKKSGTALIVVLTSATVLSNSFITHAEANRHFGDVLYQTSAIGATFTYDPEQKVEGLCYVGYIVSQNKQDETTTTQPSDETTATSTTTVSAVTSTDHDVEKKEFTSTASSSESKPGPSSDTTAEALPDGTDPEKLIEFLKRRTLTEAEAYINFLISRRLLYSIERVNYFRSEIGLPPLTELPPRETESIVEEEPEE